MTHQALEKPVAVVGESNNYSVSLEGKLEDGEMMIGTPLVEEQDTTDLTITNKVISVAVLPINGIDVPAGRAIQFHATGQLLASSPYHVKLTATTDSVPPQVKVLCIEFPADDC